MMNLLARQANTCALFSGWLLFTLSKTRNLMYETKKIQQDTRLPRCILVFSVVPKNFLQVFNFQLDVILSKQHLLYWISPNSAAVSYIRPRYFK